MTNHEPDLDTIFRSLADPTRRAVVERLGEGEATIGELAEPFGMSLPSFMQHIGVLETAGMIVTEKRGRSRTCKLRPEALTSVEHWLGRQQKLWAARYRNLDALLDAMDGEENDD